MERVRPPQPAVAESPGEPVPAERDPARLPELISALQATKLESDRNDLTFRINELLIAMRAPGNESAEAKAVLQALDLEQLNGLVDQNGRSCRGEAVDTLLACGFPHALNVRPEDLAHRDEHVASKSSRGAVAGVLASTAILLSVLTVLSDFVTALMVLLLGGGTIGMLIVIIVSNAEKNENPKP